jgi:hypothetical protein
VVAAHFCSRQLFFIFLISKTKERQKEMEQKSESSLAMLKTVVVAEASCAVAPANGGLKTHSTFSLFDKGYVPPKAPCESKKNNKRAHALEDDKEDVADDDGEEDDDVPQRTKGKKTKTPAEKKKKKYKQTNAERVVDVKKELDVMRLKLANFKGEPKLKPRCRRVDGGFIEMKCVGCNKWKERTTENFTKNNGGKNFETCAPGHESLKNSASRPCNTCFATMTSIRDATSEGYVTRLCAKYPPHINPMSFMKVYDGFGGISPWGGVKMVLAPNADNRAGIHNLDNTDKTHKNWTIDLCEFNVQQHGDVIPCIETDYTKVYTKMNEIFTNISDDAATDAHLNKFTTNFNSTPKQNGVTASRTEDSKLYDRQLQEKHLKKIMAIAIANHYANDIKKNRIKPVADPKKFKKDLVEKVLALILKQLGKCHYNHIPLTIKNLYTRFSLERLDNNKAHFNADGTITDTTVIVCRLFNVSAQMSRKKLLTYYLNQKLVAVPAEARKRAALEFSTL